MMLLRVSIATLLSLPVAHAQAADVSRMAVTPVLKGSQSTLPMAPNVAKTPSGPAPVAVPLPGTAPVVTGEPVPKAGKVSKVDAITIKQGAISRSTGDEAGTLKGIVSIRPAGGGVVRLNPLDDPRPAKLGDGAGEQDQTRLQEAVNKRNRGDKAVTDVQKKQQDTSNAIINNLK